MNLLREDIFELWAPVESRWSAWAIPVLFAQLPEYPDETWFPELCLDLPVPKLSPECERCAVVVDLPGAESIEHGFSYAQRGLRPVPLFNGCHGRNEVIDQTPIMRGLCAGAAELSRLSLPEDAPPVFLVDSRRLNGRRPISTGMFDNRWKIFPQDFPSAPFLQQQNIKQCLVVQMEDELADDLCHVLRRWQDAGIAIWRTAPTMATPIECEVPRPPAYESIWYRPAELAQLRQSWRGGFGDIVPEPRQG